LWGQLSSASCFPPTVKPFEIAKPKGGTRKLGIPTAQDTIAQTAVNRVIEAVLDPIVEAV